MEVFGPPTITPAKFAEVLAGSPVLQERPAKEYYDTIVGYGLDPAFLLAVFKHESDCGRNPRAVVNRYGTKNWGNTRSLSLNPLTLDIVPPLVDTDRGKFVKFHSWLLGLRDACYRLVSPAYPYARAKARQVETIIPIWAPSGDLDNKPAAYIASVLTNMLAWRKEVPKVKIPKPSVIDLPSPNRGYNNGHVHRPEALLWHVTDGTDSRDWLTSPASNASSNYLIRREGKRYELVPPTIPAWANGVVKNPNRANLLIAKWLAEGCNFNQRVISLEFEGKSSFGKGGSLTLAQIAAGIELSAWLCQEFDIAPDRAHIFGHNQIDSVNRANCPGFSEQEWNRWVLGVKELAAPLPQPASPVVAPARPEGWLNATDADTFRWYGEGAIVERWSRWYNEEKKKFYHRRWSIDQGYEDWVEE